MMTDTSAFYVPLPNRGLITLSGPDRHTFLQGLITNDIEKLKTEPCIYACLLTPQGKFLHDFFVLERDDTLLLDCEFGDRAEDLARRLKMYKLRANVQIECEKRNAVFAITGEKPDKSWPDPRHPDMGHRSFTKPELLPEQSFEIWDEHRIRLTIPDGSRDLIPEKSTMDEARMDTLNGVDYDKGCYVGQELTARMHYRGLGKKHLYTIAISEQAEKYPKSELRSQCNGLAIALVRDTDIQ
jgi:hypothetical protein